MSTPVPNNGAGGMEPGPLRTGAETCEPIRARAPDHVVSRALRAEWHTSLAHSPPPPVVPFISAVKTDLPASSGASDMPPPPPPDVSVRRAASRAVLTCRRSTAQAHSTASAFERPISISLGSAVTGSIVMVASGGCGGGSAAGSNVPPMVSASLVALRQAAEPQRKDLHQSLRCTV